ncbi:MAG: hypothetical protein WBE97_11430 [Candidatus Acidiferrales bacterium]
MTENKKTAVFGIYSTLGEVDNATYSLLDAGFFAPSISVLLPENIGTHQIGTEKTTKAPEGAATGAGSGAILGGALGLLAGLGALAIPGLGPLIAAGPIVATLAGMGAGGAVGGFTGALIGLGIPEYEAKRYEGHLQKGAILLSVHCDTSDEVKRAKDALKKTGAADISSAGESSVDSAPSDQRLHDTVPDLKR